MLSCLVYMLIKSAPFFSNHFVLWRLVIHPSLSFHFIHYPVGTISKLKPFFCVSKTSNMIKTVEIRKNVFTSLLITFSSNFLYFSTLYTRLILVSNIFVCLFFVFFVLNQTSLNSLNQLHIIFDVFSVSFIVGLVFALSSVSD